MRTSYDTTKRHILDAGQKIIAVKGFSGVGLSEILSAAAIPKGSFYHYFGSKEQYGRALMEQYVEDYLQALNQVLQTGAGPARERLLRYWSNWRETQAGGEAMDKCLVVKLSAEVADLSDDMRLVLCAGTQQVMARIADCIAEGIADGSLQLSLEPQKTAQMLYQLWLGASLLAKLQRDRGPLENAMEISLSVLASP
ncbi:TetR/AcrR family transcriptional regulator [Collimonas pratensis]|uniref:Bacterial regulatory s, tetR family protein n=1 Tax=Collimonas pratensis TaxID=279113 RepID=A0A127QZU9_9BURK|nr:TetR/AcrR family transcriptional regulator [Collimonas pratensis]AMP04359.1 bacterial regulatory s, tetR family protein [Collimonas pratensis]AMP15648.1 bacterial regulatory s, tetR family protein [Collimonas pratensis]NKI69983.1 TetR family transcriptional regulator [Collimonas pratensis]